MINLKQLSNFLVTAKKAGYAAGNKVSKVREKNKSKTIIFEKGDWKYHDNYFGGEPYGGREVVFFKNQPVYIMTYYGFVDKSILEFETIYEFLQEALTLIPKDKPFRGPKKYKGKFLYVNKFQGTISCFSGEEIISVSGKEIYKAKYTGGLINQRKEK